MNEGTSTSSSGSYGSTACAFAGEDAMPFDRPGDDSPFAYEPEGGTGGVDGAAGGAGGRVAAGGSATFGGRPKPETSRRATSGVRGGGGLYGAAGGRVP